jgi:DNA-binding PadR family transcriptional regulator
MPARDPNSQLPLTPVVLHILLSLAEGARHGYAIAHEIEETTGGTIRMGPGTLYGSIQRMLSSSLIDEAPAPHRTSDGDARRRYYRMTPFGRSVLELELDRLARIVRSPSARRVLRDPGVA